MLLGTLDVTKLKQLIGYKRVMGFVSLTYYFLQSIHVRMLRIYGLLCNWPAEEIDIDEDIFSVVEIQLGRFDHDLPHRVRRGAQQNNCKHTSMRDC